MMWCGLLGLMNLNVFPVEAQAHAEKENLAGGALVSATSCYGQGYEPHQVADGNFGTRWASSEMTGAAWLTLDLRGAKTFNCVNVYESVGFKGRIERVTVSVSENGIDWKRWATRRPANAKTTLVGTPVVARYVQVAFEDCSPEGINIDEVEISNNPLAVASAEPVAWREASANWITQQPGNAPNVYQIRKAHLKYGMFIHYGINTFLGQEWTDGSASASAYNPDLSTLDPEAWVRTAYEGGMNFIVLVTKHHDGFALWNTQVGTYNINHTGRKGDRRDIVKEVADACRKYGIKLGLYYSSWDRNWDANHTQESTGWDRVQLCQAYNDFALAQITELMDGRYGEIAEFWIDGPWVKSNGAWEFARMYDTVKRLQPSCQMAINTTVRCGLTPDKYRGGEDMYYFPSDFRLHDPMFTRRGADADPKVYRHEGKEYYLPFEATVCMNNTWFWSEKNKASDVMSPERIKEAYEHMVEQGNTLVVNLAPGKNGLFNDYDIEALYAGARALGIARGNARDGKDKDEEAVRVDYVTDQGYVAWPTEQVYGKKGERFALKAKDLEADGYEFVGKRAVAEGKFGRNKRVTFVYKDKAQERLMDAFISPYN